MTVSTLSVFASYAGDGVRTDFPTTFQFQSNDHVVVSVDVTLQVSGYSVTGAGDEDGGTVIFDVAPDVGTAVLVERILPIVQEIDPINNATVFGSVLSRGLDYVIMVVQQLARMVLDINADRLLTQRVIRLEQLGAIGDGLEASVPADLAAIQLAEKYLRNGYDVVGYGDYGIDEDVIFSADDSAYDDNRSWSTITRPRRGRLDIKGSLKCYHDGVGLDMYGNRGGAAGVSIRVRSLIGPGKEFTNSVGFRMEGGENRFEYDEILGFYTPGLRNGCWDSPAIGGSIFNCHTGILSQLGTNNGSTNNANVNRFQHLGGAFMNALFPERRALSAKHGLYVDHETGSIFEGGDIQYCQLELDGDAAFFGPDAEGCQLTTYLEGVRAYPATGALLRDQGRNNQFRISASLSPDNVLNAITLEGHGGRLSGLDQRTDPFSVAAFAPNRGAGAVRILPGNEWTDPSNVHVIRNVENAPYNMSSQSLGGYARSGNCTYAALTSGLPDISNFQNGARFTVSDNEIAFARSPTIVVAAAAYDRPISALIPFRLVDGPACIAPYLQQIIAAVNTPLPKAFMTQGLVVEDEWEAMRISAVLPAGVSEFQLRYAMRTVDDSQVGGCVIDVAFPLISFFKDPFSQCFVKPLGPNIIRGKEVISPLRRAVRSTTVSNVDGSCDFLFAPKVVVTSAPGGNLLIIANPEPGETLFTNRTGADLTISAALLGGVAKVLPNRRSVYLEYDGTDFCIQG